ncbi:MAG: hypothetical protein AAFO57_00565 [Pseudomonadota bacterium]
MEDLMTVSGKIGRSAMILEQAEQAQADAIALALGDAGQLAVAEMSGSHGTQLWRTASHEMLRGLVFIGSGSIGQLRSTVQAAGVIATAETSVFLECGQAADALFCLTTDDTFDLVFKALRETCLAASASGVVFFGEAEVSDHSSLRSLSRSLRLSEMTLGSHPLSLGVQSDNTADQSVELCDLSRVFLGNDCPNVGRSFPQTIRLRIQAEHLH